MSIGLDIENNSVINLIRNTDFYGALKCFEILSKEQQREIIIQEASLTDDISILGFVNFLISQNNCYFYHMLAAEAYIQMCFLEGAYNVAMFHACEMHRLNPSIEAKKFLLSFYGIPEHLLPLEKALQVANEIIKIEPDYKPALEILDKKFGDYSNLSIY